MPPLPANLQFKCQHACAPQKGAPQGVGGEPTQATESFSQIRHHHRRQRTKDHRDQAGWRVGTCRSDSRKFLKRGVLVDHLRRHQDPETFKCSICGRVMGHRRSLELHMRMHEIKSRGRLYRCEQCSKAFYSAVVYERHKLTHIPREQWKVPCTHCEKT